MKATHPVSRSVLALLSILYSACPAPVPLAPTWNPATAYPTAAPTTSLALANAAPTAAQPPRQMLNVRPYYVQALDAEESGALSDGDEIYFLHTYMTTDSPPRGVALGPNGLNSGAWKVANGGTQKPLIVLQNDLIPFGKATALRIIVMDEDGCHRDTINWPVLLQYAGAVVGAVASNGDPGAAVAASEKARELAGPVSSVFGALQCGLEGPDDYLGSWLLVAGNVGDNRGVQWTMYPGTGCAEVDHFINDPDPNRDGFTVECTTATSKYRFATHVRNRP